MRVLPIMALGLIAAVSSSASTVELKQVLIESKMVEVSRITQQEIVFMTQEGRDSKSELAAVISKLSDKTARVEITALTTGGGADFRKWVPKNPQLVVTPIIGEGELVKLNIIPEATEVIYITKPSKASPVAPILFGIIGSQYEGPGADAAKTPGQVCPVTGQALSESQSGHGQSSLKTGIDKAGMAVGMGMLASQAKGQIDGLKMTFSVPYEPGSILLKFDAYNTDKRKIEPMLAPLVSRPSTAAEER